MLEQRGLTSREHESLREIKKDKEEIFTFDSNFDHRLYQDFQDQLHGIIDGEQEWEKKAGAFLELWQEVVTQSQSVSQEKKYPAIALVELIQRSWSFFNRAVSAEQKQALASAQVALLVSLSSHSELKHVCQGMWANYGDPARRKLDFPPGGGTRR